MKVELHDWDGNTKYANYDTFKVANEEKHYKLTVSGYSGDAGRMVYRYYYYYYYYHYYYYYYYWASMRESLSSVVCEQHKRRPACVAAQSDQRLCYLLI